MTAEHDHVCPLCGLAGLRRFARYPRYVCPSCAAQAESADGRLLRFTNEGMWGGFVAAYADDGTPYPEGGRCFIRGVPCRADEARFGGIVVQVIPEPGAG